MTGNQFGFQAGELQKIQRDFEQVNQRMEEMTGKIGHIKATIAKAAATDVLSGWIMGVLGAGKILAEVTKDVHDIHSRAEALAKSKEKLTKELGEDVAKIRKMIAAYEEVERKIAEDLKRKHQEQAKPPAPKKPSPSTGIDGTGNGGGTHKPQPQPQPPSPSTGIDGGGDGGTGTVTGGPGGKHDGPSIKDRSTGDWQTHMINGKGWDDWSRDRNGRISKVHLKNGQGKGVLAKPNLAGVSAERQAIVGRALERAEHKLGYSQGAVTNGYRVDCSGLVSCAWGLPGPGLDTHGLMRSSVSHHIGKDDLKPGDAMIAGDHTVLFGGWTDSSHTSYIGIEDSGDAGMVSRKIPYPYFHGGNAYQPYRRNGVE
ncbi:MULTISPECIES: hypothetical protein [Kitasatospora]|uniref:NlpC/P60 domain-containing protein n=1 Tax=Kitasatospora setae (strain ATCC 33774 / DSM 43861 / JCM 3304 / KCC A-0304 / NBRC 14216 / KM-6054) TaxID=452652 RepID=E4MZL7_KITSK|nr:MULTISPECIES: hypothetical protein [Kitasatospora]BAJ29951.1 hypothetical protein KSE_41650 [Kitasatospora setae KM-6054]